MSDQSTTAGAGVLRSSGLVRRAVALSIRQPWAWLIVNGHKPIENRTWSTKFFGPLLIHAGKSMTTAEYEDCADFAIERGVAIPSRWEIVHELGGIVGSVDMCGCVSESDNPWFVGPFGFVFKDAKPLPFTRCKGALGFFEASTSNEKGQR